MAPKKANLNAKFKMIDFNCPLRYKIEAKRGKKKQVLLTYLVDGSGNFVNTAGTGIIVNEKK